VASAEGLIDSNDDLHRKAERLNDSVRVLNEIVGGVKRKEAGISYNDDMHGQVVFEQEQAVSLCKKNAFHSALPNTTA